MVSKKVQSIKPSGVRAIFDMAQEDSINLGLGELDFRPPREVTEACKKALDSDSYRYGPTMGIPSLREKIAQKISKYNKDIKMSNVMITSSGTQGAMATFQTLFQEGDEVLIPDPGFVVYSPECTLCGAQPVPYTMNEELNIDIEKLKERITKKTRGIVVNSPANPCGSVLTEETFKTIRDLAEDHNLLIVSDEVYENFVYEGKHYSFNECLDRSVVLNSFSKSFAVAGWRIGYLSASEDILGEISKMQYHILACPPGPFQYALNDAFGCQKSFIDEIFPILKKRRDLTTDLLNEIPGFSCIKPRGAFYAFPSYEIDIPSADLAVKLAHKGVLCSPGTAFGDSGEKHLRISYAASEDKIRKGIEIIRDFVEKF